MPFQATFGNGSFRTYGLGATKRKIGANVAIQYLVVAGGGGSYEAGTLLGGYSGGGGAGGFRTGTLNTSGGVRLVISVGAGGSGPTPGTNSSILRAKADEGVWSNVISDGGGNGEALGQPGGIGPAYPGVPSRPGGSGGGGGATAQWNGIQERGSAGYPPQGNNGGGSAANPSDRFAAGGGGGAGGAGGYGVYDNPWAGGAGGASLASPITGTPVNYAGGGAAGSGTGPNGATASPGGAVNSSAPANGGGGAGGLDSPTGTFPSSMNGGSGVVVIRSAVRASNTVGSPTETQVGDDWVYTYTNSGEIVMGTV
jgi:hypothetical protein